MEFVEPIRDKRKIELVKVILKENGFRDYMLFLMGINSGLRISDILKLKTCLRKCIFTAVGSLFSWRKGGFARFSTAWISIE